MFPSSIQNCLWENWCFSKAQCAWLPCLTFRERGCWFFRHAVFFVFMSLTCFFFGIVLHPHYFIVLQFRRLWHSMYPGSLDFISSSFSNKFQESLQEQPQNTLKLPITDLEANANKKLETPPVLKWNLNRNLKVCQEFGKWGATCWNWNPESHEQPNPWRLDMRPSNGPTIFLECFKTKSWDKPEHIQPWSRDWGHIISVLSCWTGWETHSNRQKNDCTQRSFGLNNWRRR